MSSAELPLGMRTVLRTIAWRRWMLQVAALVATVIAATLATVLAWLFVDAYWNLPPLARAAGPWAAMSVFALLTGLGIRRFFVDGMDETELAQSIDRAYPELQERFSTCRDLLQQPTPKTRMERWFRGQLQRETIPQLGAIHPERVIVDQRPFWAAACVCVLFVIALIPQVWWGAGYAHLWSRWERPWENLGWGRLAAIATTPRDGFAIRDRDFLITATLTQYRPVENADVPLTVHWRTVGDRTWQERSLQGQELGAYSGVIPHVPRDVEWYVTGPAVESPRSITRVIDPPQIIALTAAIDPPGYTRQASRQTSVAGDLAVLAGSRVQFSLMFDQPLKQVELRWPNGDGPDASATYSITLKDHGSRGAVDVVATTSGPFSFRLMTPQGLVIDDPPRSLSVRPDQKPVVKLHGPASLALRPDDRHEITAHVDDDYGLTATELYVEIAGRSVEPIALPLPRGTTTTADVADVIDLLPWKLAPGTSVLLRVRALDNREHPGPQEGWSAPQVIVISTSAISDAERRLADNTRQSRNELGEIIKQLEEERTKLRDIHQKTAAATVRQKQAEQDERLKEIAASHEELQERLQDFAAMLPDDEPGEALRQQTEQVADGPLEAAAKKLEATPKLEPRDQIPTLSQALDDLAAAKKALQKIDDALIARSALGDDLKTLQQLANRSDRVAEQMEQSEPTSDEAAQREVSTEVQKIRDELAQVVQRRPEWQAAMQQAEQAARAEQAAQQLAEIEAQAAAERPASALAPENTPSPSEPSVEQTAMSESRTPMQNGKPAPADSTAAKPATEESGQPMPNGKPAASGENTPSQSDPSATKTAMSETASPTPNGKPASQPAASGPVSAEAGAELSKARQQLTAAQEKLSPMPGENDEGEPAMIALQEAAKALRAAIEKTAGPASSPEPGAPPSTPNSQAGRAQPLAGEPGEAGATGEDAALADFTGRNGKGTSNRNWGRLPTGLKTEILQGSKRPAHSDYARQVQRYFERIAQPSPAAEPESTP